jgi:hypothetical protein
MREASLGYAARQNFKLARLHFENHGTCDAGLVTRGGPELFCQTSDHWLGFDQENILLKRILN